MHIVSEFLQKISMIYYLCILHCCIPLQRGWLNESGSKLIFVMHFTSLKYFLLTLAFATCLISKSFSQPYYFRHYQVENGLSNNAVICCLQDKEGFMWFGTKDGLNRFDGYSFKTFRNNPLDSSTIGNNFIHCLFVPLFIWLKKGCMMTLVWFQWLMTI